MLAFAVLASPALAARPIVDMHKLDRYFALFASDSNVPWQPTDVRLDTYTSAPVHFAVYQVDPGDVLTAGSNARPRAIVTRGRRPIVAFDFKPPGGYQFQSSEVDARLGNREGFFVVEASRDGVGEQVWINRTRVGLVTKETPGEILLYASDLGTGVALKHMRVEFVVNGRFETRFTDAHGIVRWTRGPWPVFALAQWGNSYAFTSFLPQAPLPPAIVGVRTDTAVVHAGGVVRVAGFARIRERGLLRPARGIADVSMRLGADEIAHAQVPVDEAGAFTVDLPVPATARAGDYAVLAQVKDAVGGATVHVDADANGLSLQASSGCERACDPDADVPLAISSSRGDVPVHVRIVRSPHVYVDFTPSGVAWGTSKWLDETVHTDAAGKAVVMIPHPTDGLGSTYGVRIESGGASAVTRIVVPTAPATIRLHLDRDEQTLGTPVNFDVYANHVPSGKPLAGERVTVEMQHSESVQEQTLTLDRDGHAHGTFTSPSLGTNFIFASIDVDGKRAMDAGAVNIVPQATSDTSLTGSSNLRISLDRAVYRDGETAHVTATLDGSRGDALVTVESANGVRTFVTPVRDGRAEASIPITDAAGDVRVGAAMVRDGDIAWTSEPLVLDAPGRPLNVGLTLPDGALEPGATTVARMLAGSGPGVAFVRISRGAPSGGALFESAPALLAVGFTATAVSAPEGRTWHPWVDSTGVHAQVIEFERRTLPPQNLTLAQADTQAVSWNVLRTDGDTLPVKLPEKAGRYTLSILKVGDDGRVIAASATLTVR